ncbi:hypothetical protein DMUE_0167 [Dictyocoela muelleri]|nr:hypothetical protein DMUE_0167 [Dictyocoela muelleri]
MIPNDKKIRRINIKDKIKIAEDINGEGYTKKYHEKYSISKSVATCIIKNTPKLLDFITTDLSINQRSNLSNKRLKYALIDMFLLRKMKKFNQKRFLLNKLQFLTCQLILILKNKIIKLE